MFPPRPAVVFAQSIEDKCYFENEDVVEAAPTGPAPTTSEWSTRLLPTKVTYIRDVVELCEFPPISIRWQKFARWHHNSQ